MTAINTLKWSCFCILCNAYTHTYSINKRKQHTFYIHTHTHTDTSFYWRPGCGSFLVLYCIVLFNNFFLPLMFFCFFRCYYVSILWVVDLSAQTFDAIDEIHSIRENKMIPLQVKINSLPFIYWAFGWNSFLPIQLQLLFLWSIQ